MKKSGCFMLTAAICFVLLLSPNPSSAEMRLAGSAEDLWGNTIDLSQYKKGIVLLHPFSPSFCGYCLVDGQFVRENYIKRSEETHTTFLGTCLFNPQMDIYTFLKHFREDFPVLTSPPTLHLYHRGGFPRITGFKDGERIINEIMCPYEDKLRKLAPTIWPGEKLDVHPTSPLHMARFFIDENESNYGLHVCPDGNQKSFDKHTEWSKETEAFSVKYENDLTSEDLKKNILLRGTTDQFRLEFLEGT